MCAGARYRIATLPSLGSPGSEARAVNRAGRAVGLSYTPATSPHAAGWGNGTVVDLHIFKSLNISFASDLNDRGQVVGAVGLGGGFGAFLWKDGFMSILPSLGGPDTSAMAVNDTGQIAGWSDVPGREHRAVLWQDGKIVELGTYPEGTESFAGDINEMGQIVGTATLIEDLLYTRRATMWHDGAMINLGTLPEGMESVAVAVSDAGQVVGWAWDTVLNRPRAVVWRRHPLTGEWVIADLGALSADGMSRATAVNNRGQIVGQAECIGTCGRAFLWENATMFDLNDLIAADSHWTLQCAWGINDVGQIVGFGWTPKGRQAFLLEPIPTAPGDFNSDGVVGPGDLVGVLARWGTPAAPSEDADEDGRIGFGELHASLRGLERPAAPTARE